MSAIKTATHAFLSASFTACLFIAPLALAQLVEFHAWVPVEVMETEARVVMMSDWMKPVQEEVEATPITGDRGAEAVEPAVAQTPLDAKAVPASMERSVARSSKPSSKTAAASPKKGKKGKCGDASEGIEKLSTANFAIKRKLISSYATHPARLNTLGWVSRHEDNVGKADGFKLGGIKCGTDLHEAGFRNGDVVHSVNGKPIHNVAQALLAYAGLKKKNAVDVAITRRGSSKTLTYHLG